LNDAAQEATVLAFVFSPVRFFEQRLRQPPDWPLALLPLILCVAAQIVSARLVVGKLQPVIAVLTEHVPASAAWAGSLEGLSVILVPFGYGVSYAMAALALVCLDVMTGDSGRGDRLAEFAGLSFFALVPYAIVTVVIAIIWSPGAPAVGTAPSLEEIRRAIESQQAAMAASPLLSTVDRLVRRNAERGAEGGYRTADESGVDGGRVPAGAVRGCSPAWPIRRVLARAAAGRRLRRACPDQANSQTPPTRMAAVEHPYSSAR
jgi:hypothetical protein